MNIIKELKFPEALFISLPYLIQEISLDELLNLKDKNGWNLLHWAIALNEQEKIEELLSYKFTFDTLSINNKINKKIFKNKKNEYFIQKTNLYITAGGYTPLHLLVFLQSYYAEKNRYEVDNKFYISLFKKTIQQNPGFLSLKDNSNLTITDYCVILKNIDLLFEILEIDSNFSGLSKVSIDTAYKTLISYKNFNSSRKSFEKDDPNSKLIRLISHFEKLNNHHHLNKILPIRQPNKKTNIRSTKI